MSSPEPVVYLLHGENELELGEHLAGLRAGLGDPEAVALNTTTLDGAALKLGDLESAAMAVPFLGPVRVVLVENLTASSGGRALIDRLEAFITSLPGSARVIFVETGLVGKDRKRDGARTRAINKLSKIIRADPHGQVFAFKPPDNAAGWIIKRAGHYDAAIERGAANLLAERLGGDLLLADSELLKLATYTGGERPIAAADVELLTPYPAEANVFRMVDALGQRDGATALRLLRKLLDDGQEPLMVFGMIVRQYRLLIQLREYLDSGQPARDAASALNMHSFVVEKLSGQCKRYNIDTLERIYHHLLDVDLSIKTGEVEPTLALDMLISRLAGQG